MNFQNLEYFIAAAKEKSITHAAEQIHISQQALSGSISRLENELGCALFERRPNLELTYAGKCFFKTATQILDIKKQGENIISDINQDGRGELKIGISHTRGQVILPMVLPEFKRVYPNVELYITESSTKILEESLEKGIIDVLIGFLPIMIDNVAEKPLVRDRLFLVLPKSLLKEHFGSSAEDVCREFSKEHDISVFKNLPFILLRESERIRSLVNRAFSEKNITPQIKTETHNIQTAFSLSYEGMGLSVCPEMYLKSHYTVPGLVADEKIITIPLFADDIYDTIGIGYCNDRYLSKMATDFINISSEKIKTLELFPYF